MSEEKEYLNRLVTGLIKKVKGELGKRAFSYAVELNPQSLPFCDWFRLLTDAKKAAFVLYILQSPKTSTNSGYKIMLCNIKNSENSEIAVKVFDKPDWNFDRESAAFYYPEDHTNYIKDHSNDIKTFFTYNAKYVKNLTSKNKLYFEDNDDDKIDVIDRERQKQAAERLKQIEAEWQKQKQNQKNRQRQKKQQ